MITSTFTLCASQFHTSVHSSMCTACWSATGNTSKWQSINCTIAATCWVQDNTTLIYNPPAGRPVYFSELVSFVFASGRSRQRPTTTAAAAAVRLGHAKRLVSVACTKISKFPPYSFRLTSRTAFIVTSSKCMFCSVFLTLALVIVLQLDFNVHFAPLWRNSPPVFERTGTLQITHSSADLQMWGPC